MNPHLVRLQAVLARPLAFWTGAVCIAVLLSYGGRWSWFCELLVNFRMHYAWLLSLALLLAIALRHWSIAGVAAATLALNVWPMYGALFGPQAPVVQNARAVRVAAFNVNIANEDLAGIAAYVDSLAADVVVLEELSPSEKAEQLAALLPRLPHRYLAEPDGIRGVVILSRWPLISPHAATREGVRFAARAEVDLGDRKFRLYGIHLYWPLIPGTARIRNVQLQALRRDLAECTPACVAAGDFNVTPWSSHFRQLLGPGVYDCAAGRGLPTTWAASLPALVRIRIDQCLTAGAVSVAGVRVGASLGSDHFATINDVLVGVP